MEITNFSKEPMAWKNKNGKTAMYHEYENPKSILRLSVSVASNHHFCVDKKILNIKRPEHGEGVLTSGRAAHTSSYIHRW